jgi:hypothetical protein
MGSTISREADGSDVPSVLIEHACILVCPSGPLDPSRIDGVVVVVVVEVVVVVGPPPSAAARVVVRATVVANCAKRCRKRLYELSPPVPASSELRASAGALTMSCIRNDSP